MRHIAANAAAASAATQGGGDSCTLTAYVYCGPGAGSRSVLSTIHSLREALVPAVHVASLDAAALLAGGWQQQALLLVMPGGADLPYCKHLNGRGNVLIRSYVEGGGAYLGLCAGAYYACARVEFEPGTRLEVAGDRELSFFPGTAAGSVYKGFCYESEEGAVAAPLLFRCMNGGTTRAVEAGSRHAVSSSTNASSNASMDANTAAGVSTCSKCSPGGRDSLPAAQGWQQAVDYVNGGPAFLLPIKPTAAGEAASVSWAADEGEWQQRQQQQRQQQQQQQQAAAAQAGGEQQLQQQWRELGVEVLATYPEHGGAAAALLCIVGSEGGRAVLCGSHPELHPSWLGGVPPQPWRSGFGGASNDAQDSPSGGSDMLPFGRAADACTNGSWQDGSHASLAAQQLPADNSVQHLQAALLAAQPQRWQLWCSLLAAAGLRAWMRPQC